MSEKNSNRVVRRFDSALAPPKVTPEGWLDVEGKLARTGIQEYEDDQGGVRRELRLPEEVFKQSSMDSFSRVPLTNRHPDVLLDDGNAKRYAIGCVGEVRKVDGEWLAAPLRVWDADTIREVKGGLRQLSAGYTCTLDPTPGVWEGQRYDSVQRDVTINHVALVDAARAGPSARLRLDSAGNAVLASDSDKAVLPANPSPNREKPMKTLHIDGLPIDLNDGNADVIQTAINRALAAEKARADSAIAAEKQRADAADKMRADADKAKAEAEKAHADFLAQVAAFRKRFDEEGAEMMKCDKCAGKGEMDGAKCDACEGKGEVPAAPKMDTPELVPGAKADGSAARRAALAAYRKRIADGSAAKSARETRARTTLESQAKGVLGDGEKFDGKSDGDIKRAVIAKLAPSAKMDGKSEADINARYDAEIERAAEQPSAIDRVRAGAGFIPPRLDSATKTGEDKQIESVSQAYKTKAN